MEFNVRHIDPTYIFSIGPVYFEILGGGRNHPSPRKNEGKQSMTGIVLGVRSSPFRNFTIETVMIFMQESSFNDLGTHEKWEICRCFWRKKNKTKTFKENLNKTLLFTILTILSMEALIGLM